MAAPLNVSKRCLLFMFNKAKPVRHLWNVDRIRCRPISSDPRHRMIQKVSSYKLTSKPYCDEARKVDITRGKTSFMFDTHALVKQLQDSGFSVSQAEGLAEALQQISQAHQDHVARHMVTKPQQEIGMQQMLAHIGSVKKDMIILEKSEFSALKHEYEKQHLEINQMKQHLQDELLKLKSGVTLDLNLEKSRARDAHADNEKQLMILQGNLGIEKSSHEKLISGLDNKIEKEIANLMATYERYRNDTIKYAGGTVMTCLTICLGFYRLWS